MQRKNLLTQLSNTPLWDIVIIGGGATGLGIAVDAASRGHKTLLLEAYDFAKGTSSRATKLVHGGVRYLAQGNLSLVYEALHERGACATMPRISCASCPTSSLPTISSTCPFTGRIIAIQHHGWTLGIWVFTAD
jgi:glycerol-3-phosphate dehydrogenase